MTMAGRINLLLVAALVASALLLVKTSYESRRVFAALDKARADQRQLDAEFKRLDTEAQAQATHLRVERVAREQLKMRSATPAITEYVADPAGTPAAPAPEARR
jgi:cell division protein FtsL